MTRTMKDQLRAARLLGLAACLATGAATKPAQALETQKLTVAAVEYAPSNLLIQLSNASNFWAQTTAVPDCVGTNSVDTLKIWHSMGQAALLSGKRLKIYFVTCSGKNYITTVDLWQ
jgi:hypothetical protein